MGIKRVAARAINQNESEATSIVKTYDDGLSRTFAITLPDGTRAIARIPHPLGFVRNHEVPTSKVLTYDITADNEVGTQYILMEAAQGQKVGKRWDSIDEDAPGGMVAAVVSQESRLMHLRLPTSEAYITNGTSSLEPRR